MGEGPRIGASRARLLRWGATGLVVSLLLAPALGTGTARSQAVRTPPPTPVPPDGSPSPFPSVLRTPTPSATTVPEIRSPSAILADLDTGQVLFAKLGGERRPIASVTKIMTALLVLESAELDEVVTVSERAAPPPTSFGLSELKLVGGERITVRELLYALMLQSANDAATVLAEHVAGSVDSFVELMNRRARRLGLTDTRFFSASGLDDRGRSTARDLVVLTRQAFRHPGFAEVVSTRFREIPAPQGRPRRIQNRNVLLWLYPGATGAKTGFTTAAGFCLVATAERDGRRLVAVILGSPGEPFSDAAALLDHGFVAFERRALVAEGESFGPVALPGGSVPVEAERDLELLIPATALGHIEREVRPLPGAAFPPLVGERVASVVVTADGRDLGRVGLVAVDVPPPPPPGGSWWSRAGRALVDAVGRLLGALAG